MRRLVAASLVTGLLLVPTMAEGASKPWSGYTTLENGMADGGFIGARLTNGKPTYRIDADASPASTGYRPAKRVSRVDPAWRRAAWIVSVYGAQRFADQAAAVDLAVYALLSDVPVGSARASARLRPLADVDAHRIRSMAKTMLRRSKAKAGPYHVTVETRPGNVGGHLHVLVSVTTAAGRPAAKLPVTIVLKGQAGAFTTSDKGQVTAKFPASTIGIQHVAVTVSHVPESRLVLRQPKHRRSSRVAVAGATKSLRRTGTVAVRAVPTVSIHPQTVADAPTPVGATYDVTGSRGKAPRTSTVFVYGPFADLASAGCTGTPVATKSAEIAGNATYSSPRTRLRTPGVYAFKVTVGANDLNAKASACGGAVRVRTTPKVKVVAKGSKASLTIAGLPPGYDDDVVVTLFGPYRSKDGVGCGGGKRFGQVTLHVTRDGTFTTKALKPKKAGVYGWRATVPAGFLNQTGRSVCGAKGSFVTIR